MSPDALLWIATLLFAAAMLILACRRQARAGEAGDDPMKFAGDNRSPHSILGEQGGGPVDG